LLNETDIAAVVIEDKGIKPREVAKSFGRRRELGDYGGSWQSQRIGAEPSGFITNLAVHKDFGTLNWGWIDIGECQRFARDRVCRGKRLTGRIPGVGGVADPEPRSEKRLVTLRIGT
jgi:hypothetical protein